MEKRLRIITHGAAAETVEKKANKCNSTPKSHSSSSLTSCSFLSDTIFEESWIDSSLRYIQLLRITKDTFKNQPILDSSYEKQIYHLSFDGPCSSTEMISALEYFKETSSVVFGHGYFTSDEFNEHMTETSMNWNGLKFPDNESFEVHCSIEKYNTLNNSDQLVIDSKAISLLLLASEVQ